MKRLDNDTIRSFLVRNVGERSARTEFAPLALSRHIGIVPRRLVEMRRGDFSQIGEPKLRLLSKFIRDWENGRVRFSDGYRRELVHLETPLPTSTVCQVLPFERRLRLVPRPAPPDRPPAPRDIFSTLTKRGSECK